MSVNVLVAAVFICITFSVGIQLCTASELNDDKISERYRRTAKSKCEELVTKNSLCITDVTWNLEVMLKSPNCTSQNKTLDSLCIEKKICGGNCSVENIDERSTCDEKPKLWKKLVLLKLLCSYKIEGISCARILFNAYAEATGSRVCICCEHKHCSLSHSSTTLFSSIHLHSH